MSQDIVILTCPELPSLTPDDQILAAELGRQGFDVHIREWPAHLGEENPIRPHLVRSTWDYYRHSQEFLSSLETIENSTHSLWNPLRIIKWNVDKSYLRSVPATGRITPLPTAIAPQDATFSRWKEIFESIGSEKIVVKPAISASSYLTRVFEHDQVFEAHSHMQRIAQRSQTLVQPFRKEIATEGELSIIVFRSPTKTLPSHIIKKTPKKGDFRVQSEFGGKVELVTSLHQDLFKECTELLTCVPGPWLYARVDLIPVEDSRYELMEIEMIEPELFFRFDANAAKVFISCLREHLGLRL